MRAAAAKAKKMRSARGHSRRPPARIGKIITPGENHHSDRCTEATAIAIVSTEKAKASRRFLVMNCLVSWVCRVLRNRRARRRPGRGPLGCDAVTMMRALYSMRAGPAKPVALAGQAEVRRHHDRVC